MLASSYISSCVSAKCGVNFPQQVGSAVGLYDGYCATANVEVPTSTAAVITSKMDTGVLGNPTSPPTNTAIQTGTVDNPTPIPNTQPESTSPSTTTSASTEEKNGLSQSDVIALAVGLGVGVPSLLLALATFLGMRRKKENRRVAAQEAMFVNGGVKPSELSGY